MGKEYILQIRLIIVGFMVEKIIEVMEIKYQKKMIHLHLLLVQYIIIKMVLEKLKIINILLKKMKLILHMQKKIFQLLKNIQIKINFMEQNM